MNVSRDQRRLRHWPISDEYSNFAKAKPERVSDDVTRKIGPLDFIKTELQLFLISFLKIIMGVDKKRAKWLETKCSKNLNKQKVFNKCFYTDLHKFSWFWQKRGQFECPTWNSNLERTPTHVQSDVALHCI